MMDNLVYRIPRKGAELLQAAINEKNQANRARFGKTNTASSGSVSGNTSTNSSGNASSAGRNLSNMIEAQYNAARKAALLENAYGTAQGVKDLKRSYEDALPSYQTSRNQAAISTQNALDNSALRSALLGDRGGIGQKEYNVTRNAGDNQQLQINLAQLKHKTDTDRQIADLQSKSKLQAVQIASENAIEALKALLEENQRVQSMAQEDDQFNKSHALKEAELTGNYQGLRTLSGQKADQAAAESEWQRLLQEAELTGNYHGVRTLSGQKADREAAESQWQKQLQEAELTGVYQGSPTLDTKKLTSSQALEQENLNDSRTSDAIRLLLQVAEATGDQSILKTLKKQLLNMI